MTNNTNKNFFTVNFFDNTISGSVANFKKASKGSGAAYEELCRLMKDHPEFKLVQIEPEKHIEGEKRSYKGLTITFMKTYIRIKKEAEADLAELDKVMAYARATKLEVFPFVKKWFIEKYGEADANGKKDKLNRVIKHFDMELAKAQISDFQQKKAKEYEAPKAAPTEAEVLPMKKDA